VFRPTTTMTDHVSRLAIIALAVSSWCGTPAGAQTAPAVFAQERSLADRPGVQQRGSWLFSTAIESAAEGSGRARSQRNGRVRRQAELQFRTAVLDRTSVPTRVPESLIPTLGALAWASTGRPFDLSGVQEVDTRELTDGQYRVVLALPRRDDIGSVTFGAIVSFLEKDVAKDRPEQDPLLLLELVADPDTAVPRVIAAMGRLHGPGMLEALSGRKPSWTSMPAWARESPRPLTELDCKEIPGRELLRLIAARPEDITPRWVFAERTKAAGLHRAAAMFLHPQPMLEWKSLGEKDQNAIREVATLSKFLDLKCNWLELIVRTSGRLPWKDGSPRSTEPVRALFTNGDITGAGRACVDALEHADNPEALSYLSAVCFEAKLHFLGADLARIAHTARPSLPYAGVNRLRHLKALGDKDTARAEVEHIAASPAIDEWGRLQIEAIQTWLATEPR